MYSRLEPRISAFGSAGRVGGGRGGGGFGGAGRGGGFFGGGGRGGGGRGGGGRGFQYSGSQQRGMQNSGSEGLFQGAVSMSALSSESRAMPETVHIIHDRAPEERGMEIDSSSERRHYQYTPQTSDDEVVVDYRKLPAEIDSRAEKFDRNSALRSAIITPEVSWEKKFQVSLLQRTMETSTLGTEEQISQKNSAFELLDALTKSGALCIDDATLHVVLASTHFFDLSLLETVINQNINPIERVERSSLILASVVHDSLPKDLILPSQLSRLQLSSPALLLLSEGESEDQD